jgi:hypothetical protein
VATAESEDSLIPPANRERRNTASGLLRPRTGADQFNPDLAAAADQFAANMLPVIREIQKEGVTSAAG